MYECTFFSDGLCLEGGDVGLGVAQEIQQLQSHTDREKTVEPSAQIAQHVIPRNEGSGSGEVTGEWGIGLCSVCALCVSG